VTLVYDQPKGNEKRFIVTQIKLDGETRDVPPGYLYAKTYVLGKKKADEAKKRTPAVTFAGFFNPERNGDYFLSLGQPAFTLWTSIQCAISTPRCRSSALTQMFLSRSFPLREAV